MIAPVMKPITILIYKDRSPFVRRHAVEALNPHGHRQDLAGVAGAGAGQARVTGSGAGCRGWGDCQVRRLGSGGVAVVVSASLIRSRPHFCDQPS
jgi:hypothetical protein